jgi:hypothetical protein
MFFGQRRMFFDALDRGQATDSKGFFGLEVASSALGCLKMYSLRTHTQFKPKREPNQFREEA